MQLVPQNISTRYQHVNQGILLLSFEKTEYNGDHEYERALE